MEVSKLVQSLRFCGDKESVCTACGRYDDMGVDGGTNACMCDLMQKAADTIEALQAELRDEMHRHDRLQDFEVAEAQQLAELRAAHRWIPVTERLPDLIPCSAGTGYSEAVNVLTSGRKVLTAIWDGEDFIADADFWDAEGEEITHWTPVLLPLPKGE